MKMTATLALVTAAVLASSGAQARHHHYRHHSYHHQSAHNACSFDNNGRSFCYSIASYAPIETHYARSEGSIVGHRPSGCPHRYCGCGVSLHIFGRIIPELNLAANWRRFPSAPCGPGKVAWRYGHVFAIESCGGDGTVVAYDPNSGGGLTRVHRVSLRGFHIVDPNGNHVALRN